LVAGQWLVVVPGLLLGTAAVLAPLRLHDLGWDAPRIAVVYLVAASIGVVVRPLVGNWADRLGQRFAIRVLLLACVVVTVAIPLARDAWLLSVVVLVAVVTYGVMWGPAMALVSSSFERAGVGQSACFALMNLTGGLGVLVGSAAGSAIAARAGDATAYLFVAAICLATYALVAQSRTPARAEGVR
jgi:MFS family permease